MIAQGASILAPMMGASDNPGFLHLCKKYGCEYIVLPMIFLDTIVSNSSYIDDILSSILDNSLNFNFKPLIFQIIGNKPEYIKIVADTLSSYDLDGINLNLGCPSGKVIKLGAGAGMLKNVEKRNSMIDACLKAFQAPFSVKIRLLGEQKINLEETIRFCKSFEEKNIDWVGIHARTLGQGYRGKANWKILKTINNEVDLFLVGNGDIQNSIKGRELIDNGYCNAFMIGRAAMKDPRCFKIGQEKCEYKTILDSIRLLEEMLNFLEKLEHARAKKAITLHQIRRWAIFFSKGVREGRNFRIRIMKAKTIHQIQQIMLDVKDI